MTAKQARAFARIRSEMALHRGDFEQYGLRNWLRMKAHGVRTLLPGTPRDFRLASRWAKHPLAFRPDSSDLFVFHQIFIEREYSCFDDLPCSGLIIDCGANVGYSSAYFLSRFPDCSVIAVEPDEKNFEVLRRNLEPYGDRARAIRAAVWSHPSWLKLSDAKYRDGLEWSRQVVECDSMDPSAIPAVDIGSLLRESLHERISLLKVDIEGAEAVVFASNVESWIGRVDNIAIEIHDDTKFGDARGVFMSAISGRGFSMTHAGELTVCRRTRSQG